MEQQYELLTFYYAYIPYCIYDRAEQYCDKGCKLEPHNPFVLMQKATVVLYMPQVFGGSWAKSIPLLVEAEKCFGEHPKYSKKRLALSLLFSLLWERL